ncbi:MAG: polysaccharide deacetylase family protein [Candidatus Accumulibacter sp.]|uniref:polysaccharide deacetylase family protein n=1 Tax=Accumulibacter sp. TaxID=2053492 RepID=UPI00258EBBB5|nr:polysaccharide deacetylase family protein [Accumulibacter sp.]MCM8620680.1 polysaccharide deacetylase family protein [Accumulibacter sp.]
MFPSWTAFRLLSPGGDRGKLFVFIFHRVLAEPDPLLPQEPDAAAFDWMVRFISRNFRVMPLGQAVNLLKARRLPSASACITFDDGYQDNFSVALPILKRHGSVATFFIATGYLDGGRMWNDSLVESVRALPDQMVDWSEFGLDRHDLTSLRGRLNCMRSALERLKYFPHHQREAVAKEIARQSGVAEISALMMRSDEVRALRAAGMEIGAHTHSHPILTAVDDQQAYAEIAYGKARLEKILGETVDVFAYPNGNPKRDLAPCHVEMVKAAGFRAAVTTEQAIGGVDTDSLLMPRFTPWDRTPTRFAARCALTLLRGQ